MPQQNKPGRKNSNKAVIARRAKVSELFLKGMTHLEIAEIYGVDRSQISKDISIIKQNWRESSLVNMNEAMQIQLAKIDLREREAWMSWEKSKLTYKENRIKTKNAVLSDEHGKEEMGVIEVEEIEQEHHAIGDPRFLSIIERCVEQRNKLLGLPLEQLPSDLNSDFQVDWSKVDSEERKTLYAAIERLEEIEEQQKQLLGVTDNQMKNLEKLNDSEIDAFLYLNKKINSADEISEKQMNTIESLSINELRLKVFLEKERNEMTEEQRANYEKAIDNILKLTKPDI